MNKIVITLLAFLTFAVVTHGQFVQQNCVVPATSGATSAVIKIAQAQSAGDAIHLVARFGDIVGTVSSITDTSGDTFQVAAGPTKSTVGTINLTIVTYVAKNIKAAAAGTNTITVSFGTSPFAPDLCATEYSGVDQNNPIDVVGIGSAQLSGDSATSASQAATTTNAKDILVGANVTQDTSTGAGAGYTSRSIQNGNIVEDQVVTAVGSYTATAPLNSSQNYIMHMVALRGATTQPSNHSVGLAWTQGVTDGNTCSGGGTDVVTSNSVYRGTTSGGETLLINIPAGTSYTDSTVQSGLTYFYQVTALNCVGESARSSEVSATIPSGSQTPSAPPNLTGVAK